jgi:hypothetical protein
VVASVATPDAAGISTTLVTPGAMSPLAGPTAQAAMPVRFYWNSTEETSPQSTPGFSSNEGLAVDLGMNASADRGGMATATAEPATTDASAAAAPGEPAVAVTPGADAPPSASGPMPEGLMTYLPTSRTEFDRPGSAGGVSRDAVAVS